MCKRTCFRVRNATSLCFAVRMSSRSLSYSSRSRFDRALHWCQRWDFRRDCLFCPTLPEVASVACVSCFLQAFLPEAECDLDVRDPGGDAVLHCLSAGSGYPPCFRWGAPWRASSSGSVGKWRVLKTPNWRRTRVHILEGMAPAMPCSLRSLCTIAAARERCPPFFASLI